MEFLFEWTTLIPILMVLNLFYGFMDFQSWVRDNRRSGHDGLTLNRYKLGPSHFMFWVELISDLIVASLGLAALQVYGASWDYFWTALVIASSVILRLPVQLFYRSKHAHDCTNTEDCVICPKQIQNSAMDFDAEIPRAVSAVEVESENEQKLPLRRYI